MKNLSIVLNVVLFVAVIVLYVLYFSGHKSPETAMTSKVAGTADATKIVYINTDTLLNNYQLFYFRSPGDRSQRSIVGETRKFPPLTTGDDG